MFENFFFGILWDLKEILNIKQVRFKQQIDTIDEETAILKVSKSEKVTANDIASSLSNFQVLNTDLLICEMDKKVEFEMNFTIAKGVQNRGLGQWMLSRLLKSLNKFNFDSVFLEVRPSNKSAIKLYFSRSFCILFLSSNSLLQPLPVSKH